MTGVETKTAKEVLGDLRARGVEIRVEAGNLHVRPASSLSEEDRDLMRGLKAEMIALLQAGQCPVISFLKTDLGSWRVEWRVFKNSASQVHDYKVGCLYSDDTNIPATSTWLINLDGGADSIIGIDLDYIDGLSDEQVIGLVRKGARAAQVEMAALRAQQVVEDFTGHCSELWTIEDFQHEYEKDYELLCRHQNEQEIRDLLDLFEPIWRGDVEDAGYVYCLSDQQGHYKLGRTKHLQARIRALGTQPPFKIQLLFTHYVFNAALYEKLLHRHFAHKRMNGEWFALDEAELESVRTDNWVNRYI